MSKSKIFSSFCLCFFLGIAFGFKFAPILVFLYLSLALLILLFVLAFFKKHKVSILVFAGVIVFLLGAWRAAASLEENQFQNILETKTVLEGIIVEDVDIRPDKQLIAFQPKGHSQKILVTTNFINNFSYGDKVVVDGKVKQVENFGDFDYEKYLQRYNVYALSNYPKILILKTNQANSIKFYLLQVKAWCVEYLSRFLQEPHLSLLLGILIGAKKSLPKDLVQNFATVGLSHVVAVSGYNISVLIVSLGFLAKFVGRKMSFWLSVIVIVAFVIMAGASASVLRAAVMGGLLLVAFRLGRPYSFAPAILFSALLMLLVSPKILLWDIGFALSFAATLGIIYGVPLLEDLTLNISEWFGLKTIFFTTICAIISTLPLSLLYFGQVSAVAILTNLLVLPLVPPVMFLGFCVFIPWFSAGYSYLVFWLLSYIIWVVNFFARLPFAGLEFKISIWTFWIIYGLVFMAYILLSDLVKNRKNTRVDSKVVLW